MLTELIDNLSPDRLRDRGQDAVREARTRIHRVRNDAHIAREEGRIRLWTIQADTLERAHEALSHTPEKLDQVVKPIRRVVDQRLERITSAGIDGYDDLNARAAGDALRGLDLFELERVERYEKAHKNRKTVFVAVERERRRMREPNGA